jgi:hypothetical protein
VVWTLWRLRRATAVESGLFTIEARHPLWFRQRRRGSEDRQEIIDAIDRNSIANGDADEYATDIENPSETTSTSPCPHDDLTQSFVCLSNLPTYPLRSHSLTPGPSDHVHPTTIRSPQTLGKNGLALSCGKGPDGKKTGGNFLQ